MDLDDYDFALPDEQIALYPAPRRDGSRLLVLDRGTTDLTDATFVDLLRYLRPEDVLVLNETRVVPARVHVSKARTGGRVELLVLGRGTPDGWLAMARPLKGLENGDILRGSGELELVVVGRTAEDRLHFRVVGCDDTGDDPTGLETFRKLAGDAGQIPLPPYIRRAPEEDDTQRYQTVFARAGGSIAAPTAGLHFTDSLLEQIQAAGTAVARLLLHVGAGTFSPIRHEDPRQHRIEAEYYQLPADTAELIATRRAAGGRVVAVGTTCVRALETCAASGTLVSGQGWTDLVVTPDHRFQVVDAMVTNFHLPRSSLLMLVSAFGGADAIRHAYAHAVEDGYRFYSYGDAMFIHGDRR
ncbi:MAG: tRNA preQ1(34) S-adenosylmethionine ribosyltransferase-isomerase QueA [Gemmatimonadetes bacterium]|jgi:S-adenosylmethionine:tRNA ribosyltransferase-isomerase|nr:tRNA preQ1(34) S-adenosylmethionine ribosyltransferase-isomerase QueA [Gemmatimonadota bacterium]MBT6143989.1 tRNA preQ1(34) S-adenosylmethionine ribosyltransferase-isomerase QueA [Gemmatimonadota bacterium]MBT7859658.1 tRNA preQ1(34) S-adenosylmethionine ribosyltransferase-isomerase QueA [Gemmatimonadota bacterium]